MNVSNLGYSSDFPTDSCFDIKIVWCVLYFKGISIDDRGQLKMLHF